MNSIIGSDYRGKEELEFIKHKLGEDTITEITGVNPGIIFSINKILYLKNHYGKIHEKTWKYLCFSDFIGYYLTGCTVIDYSMASRTMMFDINTNTWSQTILEAAELSQDILPDPVPGGTIVGTVLPSVASKLGLENDVQVMVGTHDHIFNAIGAGAVEPGICSNAVGTTEGLTTILKEKLPTCVIRKYNISSEPFVLPGLFNTVAWNNTAGAVVNWFIHEFYRESGKAKDEILQMLNSSVKQVPSRLMVIPRFAGSTVKYMDDLAKGAVLGLTMTTQKEEIYQAILEGTAFECRVLKDCLTQSDIPIDRIIMSGGGSKSSQWLQIRADIWNHPVYCSANADTGAIGGAMLGAVMLGIYPDLETAAEQMLGNQQVAYPRRENSLIYEKRYAIYRELYEKLYDLDHIL